MGELHGYGEREQTRTDHLREVAGYAGWRSVNAGEWKDLDEFLFARSGSGVPAAARSASARCMSGVDGKSRCRRPILSSRSTTTSRRPAALVVAVDAFLDRFRDDPARDATADGRAAAPNQIGPIRESPFGALCTCGDALLGRVSPVRCVNVEPGQVHGVRWEYRRLGRL
jgi:hypothetical protein